MGLRGVLEVTKCSGVPETGRAIVYLKIPHLEGKEEGRLSSLNRSVFTTKNKFTWHSRNGSRVGSSMTVSTALGDSSTLPDRHYCLLLLGY